jgi:sortase A
MAISRRETRKKKKAAGKSKLFKTVATLLIIAGVVILGYAGLQRVLVEYNQAKLRDAFEATAGFSHLDRSEKIEEVYITEWQPMRLVIPAIEVDLMAVGDGDVFSKTLLDQGPTHFNDLTHLGVNVPGDLPNTEKGNVVFAGHRAGRWNFFLNINELEEGDEIYLDVGGYRFIYMVEWVEVFSKYDWDPIETTDYPAITLQTCDPPHVSNPDWRLMVRGALETVEPIPLEAPDAN